MKKKRKEERERLIEEISLLEQNHKKFKGQNQESFCQLASKREELRDSMEQDSKRALNKLREIDTFGEINLASTWRGY